MVLEQTFDFSSKKTFSVSAWIYPEKDGAIISRMDHPNDYRGFDMLLVASQQLEIHLIHQWPVNAIKITTKDKIPFGQWSHVCVTYDGSCKPAGFNIFLNQRKLGVNINSDSLSGPTTTEHPIWVGFRGATPKLDGQISRLRVFDTRLTDQQRFDLFGGPLLTAVSTPSAEQTEFEKRLTQLAFESSFSQEYFDRKNQLTDLRLRRQEVEKSTPTTMILKELASPRDTYILDRGLYDQPKTSEKLTPGIPVFLPQPAAEYPIIVLDWHGGLSIQKTP